MSENINTGKENNVSDIDKALNTKGFAEFLAQHPDAEEFDMNDEGAINKRFEVFESKGIVSKEIKELYSGHIEKEMGIKLDKNDLASIDKHIEEQAINNPDEVINLREQLYFFKELPKKIAESEKQLAQLGNADNLSERLESLRTDSYNIEEGKKYLGFVGKSRLAFHLIKSAFKASSFDAEDVDLSWDSANNVTRRYGKMNGARAESLLEGINKEIETTEDTLSKISEAEVLKSEYQNLFKNMRSELLGGVAGMAELTAAIQAKVHKQLMDLTSKGTIKDYEQAQQRFDSLKSVSESTETGVDPLGRIDAQEFEKDIEDSIVDKASEEMMGIILQAKMGDNALTNLEKSLEPFLKKEKIGSKEGNEARQKMSDILAEVYYKLGTTSEDKAKKLMISRILIKMNQ